MRKWNILSEETDNMNAENEERKRRWANSTEK